MIYIVYKKPEDKEKYENYFNKINNFLYRGKETALNKFYRNVKFVNYSTIDEKVLKEIEDDDGYIHESKENTYYKSYKIQEYRGVKDDELSDIINIYTTIVATRESHDRIEDYYEDNTALYGIYGAINTMIEGRLKEEPEEISMQDDLLNFILLAFSNRVDVFKDNDIIKGYLYDREGLRDKYEDLMGEDAFRVLDYNCSIVRIHRENLITAEFSYLIKDLRRYFYLKMSKKDDVSLNERNSMIINFDSLYVKLRDEYLYKNKKTL